MNNKVEVVHLLVQSTGGYVGDGIAIYNYLRNLPLNIVAYNAGSVMSIGVIVFLAANYRKASATASFMIHRSTLTPNTSTTVFQLQNMAEGLKSEDARTESILREHVKLSDDRWKLHEYGNLTLPATEALDSGMIHEIADFAVLPGNNLYNI